MVVVLLEVEVARVSIVDFEVLKLVIVFLEVAVALVSIVDNVVL